MKLNMVLILQRYGITKKEGNISKSRELTNLWTENLLAFLNK